MGIFQKRSIYQRTLRFVYKKPCFLLIRAKNMLTSFREDVKKIWLIAGILNANCGLFNRGSIRHMYYASLQGLCRHFKKKKKDFRLLNWMLLFRQNLTEYNTNKLFIAPKIYSSQYEEILGFLPYAFHPRQDKYSSKYTYLCKRVKEKTK